MNIRIIKKKSTLMEMDIKGIYKMSYINIVHRTIYKYIYINLYICYM